MIVATNACDDFENAYHSLGLRPELAGNVLAEDESKCILQQPFTICTNIKMLLNQFNIQRYDKNEII